jgi:ABC-type Zn uptake system ZnuABC Zn-binding protein ZnuA
MRPGRILKAVLVISLLLPLFLALAPSPSVAQTRLKVVTTVAPIASLIQNIAGNRIDLTQLVPDGINSHTFEPRPSDARIVAEGDLFVVNGLNLETPTLRMISANAKPGAQVLLLGDNTITRDQWMFDRSFPQSRGDPNPHLWLNVDHARRYAQLISDKLVEMDPANADYYRSNTERLFARLDQLDRAIFAAVQTIPPQNRRLVTYHDSWPYFANRYGFEVVGAIQPSDFAEPRPRDIAAIIEQVRRSGVPAVFGSEVFPSRVLEAIGRETGVRYVDTLRDDALPGAPNSPEHTYVGMMLANLRTMVGALGGDTSVFAGIDPGSVAQ